MSWLAMPLSDNAETTTHVRSDSPTPYTMDKPATDIVSIEQSPVRRKHHTHYEPETDEERRLDRAINWKLDLVVVLILSIDFIVSRGIAPPTELPADCNQLCGIDKTNIGFVATTSITAWCPGTGRV